MFLYEIYYINKYKPTLNKDDKSKEKLTIELPELDFKTLHNEEIMEKWKNEIAGEREAAKRKEELEEFFW